MALFERVGFQRPERMLKTYPFELSGGMRQRAMIAMALICKPALLIADEPTTALDVTTQAQILALIKEIQAEMGMAVMLITHDLGVVANLAEDVLVMYRGEVMERGSARRHLPAPAASLPQGADPRRAELRHAGRRAPHAAARHQGLRRRHLRRLPRRQSAAEVSTAKPARCWRSRTSRKTFTLRSGLWSGRQETVQGAVGRQPLHPVGHDARPRRRIRARARRRSRGSSCGPGRRTKARSGSTTGPGRRDVFELDTDELKAYRRAVQFVFQDPFSSLNPRMTIYDILSEPLRIHEIGTSDERHERVKGLLELVGLDQRSLRRYPHSFSGGERQRIGLARALALSPSVILCDEPTSALDVSVQAQVLNLLKDLQKALGISYLFVSHNLAVVDYMATEIAVMCRGHIVEQAPREILFRDPQHPYTRALLAGDPGAGHQPSARLRQGHRRRASPTRRAGPRPSRSVRTGRRRG